MKSFLEQITDFIDFIKNYYVQQAPDFMVPANQRSGARRRSLPRQPMTTCVRKADFGKRELTPPPLFALGVGGAHALKLSKNLRTHEPGA